MCDRALFKKCAPPPGGVVCHESLSNEATALWDHIQYHPAEKKRKEKMEKKIKRQELTENNRGGVAKKVPTH